MNKSYFYSRAVSLTSWNSDLKVGGSRSSLGRHVGFLICYFIIVLFLFSVYLLPDKGVAVGILGVTLGIVGAETKHPLLKNSVK